VDGRREVWGGLGGEGGAGMVGVGGGCWLRVGGEVRVEEGKGGGGGMGGRGVRGG